MAAGRPRGIGAKFPTRRGRTRQWSRLGLDRQAVTQGRAYRQRLIPRFLRARNGRSVGTWSERYREAGRVRRVRGGFRCSRSQSIGSEIPVLRALTCIFGSSRFFRLRAHVRLSLVIDFEGPKRDPRVSTVGC